VAAVRRLLLVLFALLGVALPAQAGLHSDTVRHARAASDGVAVDLSYRHGRHEDRSVRIEIRRRGRLGLSAPVDRFACRGCAPIDPVVFGDPLSIRDLDGDGEPEVLLDLFTGGAHCCFYTVIFRYYRGTYRGRFVLWGDPGSEVDDLEGDGRPELVSADDRFAYAFTDYADSVLPVQVWRYDHGELRDVSASYKVTLRSEAADLWRTYLSGRRDRDDPRGVLAAWVADEVRLGRSAQAWKQLDTLLRRGELTTLGSKWAVDRFWPDGRAYVSKLRRFLKASGYRA
jgi:hypothetical protein